jgi:hypothetical protein
MFASDRVHRISLFEQFGSGPWLSHGTPRKRCVNTHVLFYHAFIALGALHVGRVPMRVALMCLLLAVATGIGMKWSPPARVT